MEPSINAVLYKSCTGRPRLAELSYFELFTIMPKAGLEPARLAAPPPQDGVSANSTTSAKATFSIYDSIFQAQQA